MSHLAGRHAAFALSLVALAACVDHAAPPPPGPPAELVAAPFTEASPYARNVWDMQRFGGRIYLAHGDAVDNWGPIALWMLDPATGRVARGYRTEEEQVDRFRILDGHLYIPGYDPRGSWAHGSFYRLEAGGWARYATIPHGIHTFDLAWHRGRLFAALGTSGGADQPSLLASADGGRTWAAVTSETRRFHDLFEFRGELYAAPKLRTDGDPRAGTLLRFDGDRFASTGLGGATLLPGLADTAGRMVRPLEFNGALVYVVASGSVNWTPAALALTRTLRDSRVVALPAGAAVPYDLLVRGRTLYVLASESTASGEHVIHVYATDDLARWREVVRFTAAAFARSFEEADGDFYFGLGSTFQSPSPASGEILRVRHTAPHP